MKPHIVGVIPARFGSTRFPGKPLHPIAGKPLLQHVWERALRVRRLDRIIVATDDLRIAEAASAFGAEVSLTSPDHPSGTDRIAEVARHLKRATHFVNIQGDEPLFDPRLVDRLAARLAAPDGPRMITAAHPSRDLAAYLDPNVVKVVCDRTGHALYFSRAPIPLDRTPLVSLQNLKSPTLPTPESGASHPAQGGTLPFDFLRHHGLYGYRRDTLLRLVRHCPTPLERRESLEQLRALEHGIRIRVILSAQPARGVDTPEDALAVERLLGKGQP